MGENLEIGLQCGWVQHCRIPIDNSMAMDCIDAIEHFVGYHAQNRGRTSEAWYHITVPARVSKASYGSIQRASVPSALLR